MKRTKCSRFPLNPFACLFFLYLGDNVVIWDWNFIKWSYKWCFILEIFGEKGRMNVVLMMIRAWERVNPTKALFIQPITITVGAFLWCAHWQFYFNVKCDLLSIRGRKKTYVSLCFIIIDNDPIRHHCNDIVIFVRGITIRKKK